MPTPSFIANTLFGLQSSSEGHVDLFEIHGAGRSKRPVKLDFLAAVPALFTGLRISAGLAVIGTIVGESSGAATGSGTADRASSRPQRHR